MLRKSSRQDKFHAFRGRNNRSGKSDRRDSGRREGSERRRSNPKVPEWYSTSSRSVEEVQRMKQAWAWHAYHELRNRGYRCHCPQCQYVKVQKDMMAHYHKEAARVLSSPTTPSENRRKKRGKPKVVRETSEHGYRVNYDDAPKRGTRNRGSARLGAGFIQELTLHVGTEVPPKTKVLKTWLLKNTGTVIWDKAKVTYIKGWKALCAQESFQVSHTPPGQAVKVSAAIVTPAEEGRYSVHFRLCQEGEFFGPKLWVDITVKSPEVLQEPSPKQMPRERKRQEESDLVHIYKVTLMPNSKLQPDIFSPETMERARPLQLRNVKHHLGENFVFKYPRFISLDGNEGFGTRRFDLNVNGERVMIKFSGQMHLHDLDDASRKLVLEKMRVKKRNGSPANKNRQSDEESLLSHTSLLSCDPLESLRRTPSPEPPTPSPGGWQTVTKKRRRKSEASPARRPLSLSSCRSGNESTPSEWEVLSEATFTSENQWVGFWDAASPIATSPISAESPRLITVNC